MREEQAGSRRWRWTALLAAAVVTSAGAMPASAAASSPSTAHRASASVAGLRNFDAVTTVNERNVWKHIAFIGDTFVVYNDSGIIQGPARIRDKWPFLPEQFTHDIDAAGAAFGGPAFRPRYTFTKGTQAIVFEDTGPATGPFAIPTPYDGISDYNNSPRETSRIFHMAVRGGNMGFFFDQNFTIPGSPLSGLPYLPERFRSDLDDVSVEIERNTTKTSYYKGNERLIVNDRGQVLELVNLDVKWPFLNAWRSGG
ncbi:hypothetical protein [Actinomadura macra]|uniref:hypothetical protein n=1 Tax=Actinomadura macra TaxID=46164 RepID=UPI0012F82489|nr:hypothetical protein [Actinomadura macra]